ncbi:tetratricopeptide repeat protein [Pontibacter sp. G13]|uniref:tetratricopeptide repeat protein n=1 Tax=Pontibacter sp. G13 TaxID=3074898 RepID=UPI00288A237C|nr:tetratricopeptide repeat protein [Pontibacter sp. G13]WNJ18372.1 tetratricopeptide repeat protein [Pontibacter sp. G13]
MKTSFLIWILCLTSFLAYSQKTTEEFYWNQALEFIQQGKEEKAIEAVNMAISYNQDELKYHLFKANAYNQMGNMGQTLRTLNLISDQFSESVIFFQFRADFYFDYNYFEMAERDYSRALELSQADSVSKHLYVQRGQSRYYQVDYEGAYEDYRASYMIDSQNYALLVHMAVTTGELDYQTETIEILTRAIEIDSINLSAYHNLGFCLQRWERNEEAIPYFNKILERQEDAYTYSNRSYSRLKTGDVKGAMKDVQKSIELDPNNCFAYRNRGLIYLEKGKNEKACQDFEYSVALGYTRKFGPEVEELIQAHCQQ